MPSTRRLLTVAFLLSFLALPLVASASAPDRRNGATWYRDAFVALERLSDADRNLINDFNGAAGTAVPPPVREVLARGRAAIEAGQAGARQAYADFGLDRSQGFDLALPHLGPMRQLARLMTAEARVALADGDGARAASLIGSISRMGSHLASDGTLISSLVGFAIYAAGDGAIQYGLDRAAFDPGAAARLAGELRGLDSEDPFGFVDSVASEQTMAVDWLAEKLGDDAARAKAMTEDGWLFQDDEARAEIAMMDDDAFAESLDGYDRAMDETVALFLLDDPEATPAGLAAMGDRLGEDEFGLLAKLMLPALGKIYEQWRRSRAMLDDRLATLDGIAEGRIDPADELDAAPFYVGIFVRISELEREVLTPLLSPGRLAKGPAQEAMDEILSRTGEAASKRRCTFGLIRHADSSTFVPSDLPDFNDLMLLLEVHVARSAAGGSPEIAVETLATWFGVIAHLSGDDVIATSLVAQHAFDRAVRRALPLAEADPAHAARLLAAAERIGRKDPFGYLVALAAAQRRVEGRAAVITQAGSSEFANQRFARQSEIITGWTGTERLVAEAIFDTLVRAGRPVLVDPAPRLAAVLDEAGTAAARDAAAAIAPRLAEGDFDWFGGGGLVPIADVDARRASARRTLREALVKLRRAARVEVEVEEE